MSSKHTPGPWALELWSGYVLVRSADGGPSLFFESQSHAGAIEDARLIAAAPELLEASRMLIDSIEGGSITPEEAIAAARAAIAKAAGGAS